MQSQTSSPSRSNPPRPPKLTLPKSASLTIRPRKKPVPIDEHVSSGPSWSVIARRGRRRTTIEDTYSIHPFIHHPHNPSSPPISLFAIFDGHGGQKAAQFASIRLPNIFFTLLHAPHTPIVALERAFLATDRELLAHFATPTPALTHIHSQLSQSTSTDNPTDNYTVDQVPPTPRISTATQGTSLANITLHNSLPRMPSARFSRTPSASKSTDQPTCPSLSMAILQTSKSRADLQISTTSARANETCGTTATVVAIIDGIIHMAHVGDSRAVLCAKGGVTRRLCEDHLAGRPDELDRIEASGGLVVDVRGVCRVNGVLAVSRAIGDIGLKDLVIANPDVCRVPLTGGEEFLLIASDGVWDVLSDEESVHMVRHILFTHEKSQEGEEEEGMEEKAAKSIIACAWDRGSTDDMSVIVVNLIKYRNMCSKYDHQDVDEVVEQIELDSLRIGSSDDGTSGSDKADSVGLLINR